MLGVFGKLPGKEPVKTRLQAGLTRAEAERFYLASLADTLETACRAVDRPVLFLAGARVARSDAEPALLDAGLDPQAWSRVRVECQRGHDLGERLQRAFDDLCAGDRRAVIIGSDSPSLDELTLRHAGAALSAADVVLGPTTDGGYYAIGLRQPHPALLRDLPWSTNRLFAATLSQAQGLGLRVEVLKPWTDVDHPEDLEVLSAQIAGLRASGDELTARHAEQVLAALGFLPPRRGGPAASTQPSS